MTRQGDLSFREAGPADYAVTRRLVDEAFRPEDVVTFLDDFRADTCVLGEWVAEAAGEPVGHVAFSRVWVEQLGGTRVAAGILTPLAVWPRWQRKGVGQALMRYSLAALEARGEALFFVLGHPEYYPKAGFSSQRAEVVQSPWGAEPAFMVRGTEVPAGKLVLPASIAAHH